MSFCTCSCTCFFCLILCIWGSIQLSFMAVFYFMEPLCLISDVDINKKDFPEVFSYENLERPFNYAYRTCACTACLYVIFTAVSFLSYIGAKEYDKAKAKKLAKLDECTPLEFPKAKPKKKKKEKKEKKSKKSKSTATA